VEIRGIADLCCAQPALDLRFKTLFFQKKVISLGSYGKTAWNIQIRELLAEFTQNSHFGTYSVRVFPGGILKKQDKFWTRGGEMFIQNILNGGFNIFKNIPKAFIMVIGQGIELTDHGIDADADLGGLSGYKDHVKWSGRIKSGFHFRHGSEGAVIGVQKLLEIYIFASKLLLFFLNDFRVQLRTVMLKKAFQPIPDLGQQAKPLFCFCLKCARVFIKRIFKDGPSRNLKIALKSVRLVDLIMCSA
jgi:hypothetical protein